MGPVTEPLFREEWLDEYGEAYRQKMMMEVGAAIARDVAESSFVADTDSPWAVEMHQGLVHPTKVIHRGFADVAVIEAEPTSWEVLARWLYRNPLVQTSTRRVRLAKRIRHEIDRLCQHPAYRGVSVAGLHPLILPAFRCGPVLGPTVATAREPAGARGFLLDVKVGEMRPYALRVRNRMFTHWVWEPFSAVPETGSAPGG